MPESTDQIKKLLRDRSLRATPTRVEVMRLVREDETAVAYSTLQASLGDTDRVTLYRTLNTLLENGLIHKALTTEQDTFYAACDTGCSAHEHAHNHIHFKCTVCDQVTCEQLPEAVQLTLPGHVISEVSISATGVCEGCG